MPSRSWQSFESEVKERMLIRFFQEAHHEVSTSISNGNDFECAWRMLSIKREIRTVDRLGSERLVRFSHRHIEVESRLAKFGWWGAKDENRDEGTLTYTLVTVTLTPLSSGCDKASCFVRKLFDAEWGIYTHWCKLGNYGNFNERPCAMGEQQEKRKRRTRRRRMFDKLEANRILVKTKRSAYTSVVLPHIVMGECFDDIQKIHGTCNKYTLEGRFHRNRVSVRVEIRTWGILSTVSHKDAQQPSSPT